MRYKLLLALLIAFIALAGQAWGWAEPTFTYRLNLTINNTAGADLTNYSLNVTLNTASLIAAGKMNADCSDIRFYASDDSTKLPYWLESGCNTSSTLFWVKLDRNDSYIYTYYGNPSAASESNGSAVFLFFDDFNDGAIGSQWTILAGTWSEVNGYLEADASGATPPRIESNYAPSEDVIIEWYALFVQDTRLTYVELSDGTDWGLIGLNAEADTQVYVRTADVNAVTVAGTVSAGVWYYMRGFVHNQNISVLNMNTSAYAEINTTALNFTDSTFLLRFYVDDANAANLYRFDNIKVRKYANPEPYVIPGAEESKSPTLPKVINHIYYNYCKDDPSCVLYLPLDNGSGTVAIDHSNYSNNGTIYDAWWAYGKFGNALQFDGVNDYVLVENSKGTMNFTNFTILLWSKLKNGGNESSVDAVFSYGDAPNRIFAIYQNNQDYSYEGMVTAPDGTKYYTGRYILNDAGKDDWRFLTLKYNSTHLTLYIDALPKLTTNTSGGLYQSLQNVTIAKFLLGYTDEILAFNRSLSDEEIKQIYRTGWLHIQLRDESTLQEITDSLTVELRNQSTFELIDSKRSSNGSVLFATIAGDYIIRSGIDSTSNYPFLRQVFKTANFPNVTDEYATLFMPQNSSTVIFDVFNKIDYSNAFPNQNTTLKLKKYISGTIRDIHEDFFDLNDKAQAWVMLYDKYQLAVHNKLTDEERVLGWFAPDPDGQVDVVITTLTLDTSLISWLAYDFNTDNSTGMIRFDWNSSLPVKVAEFWVNFTNGTLVYYSNSTADAGSFIYYANNSQNYIVRYRVETLDGNIFDPVRQVLFAPKEYLGTYFEIFPRKPGWDWLYTVASIAFIMFIMLGFGKNRAHIATGLGAAMAMFFYYINWYNVPRLALALAVIIALAAFLERGRRDVE